MNIESYEEGVLTGFDLPEARSFKIKSGFVECTKGAGGYAVSRIISTDLRDYLDPKMAIGERWQVES